MIVIKKIPIFLILLLFLFVTLSFLFSTKSVYIPNYKKTIVIDAGHGGIDGGCVGKKTGITESELNLKYSIELKSYFEKYGFEVEMTRQTMDGLYALNAKNKKKSEMENRKKIITQKKVDCVVSIHMNSMRQSDINGAQVFFKKDNEIGRLLAKSITETFCEENIKLKNSEKEGDYFILNCSDKASVLIECGYLSNENDEMNLLKDEYREKMCKSILKGVLEFLQIN